MNKLLSIETAAHALGCGRARVTRLIKSGDLRTFPPVAKGTRRLPFRTRVIAASIADLMGGGRK